ncbi:hypothetical protein ACIBCD_27110 [Nocardia brasiliensis]|uniref:hypothetical protein n=1 Tax=Nocardia brasiliensis TaxID=37326 RepID=UPI00379FE2CC
MSGWLFLIVAFGSWFVAGTIFGLLLMSGRSRSYPSPGCGQEITTPGAGESDLAPGVASNP